MESSSEQGQTFGLHVTSAGAGGSGVDASVDKLAVDLLTPALAADVRGIRIADEVRPVKGLQLPAVVQLQAENKAGGLVLVAAAANKMVVQ